MIFFFLSIFVLQCGLAGVRMLGTGSDHLDNKEYCEDKVSERLEKDDI